VTAVIETERLVLRRWQDRDLEPFAELNADPEVMRYIGTGRPLTRDESDAFVGRIEAGFEEHGFGLWCAEPRDGTTPCIGFTGLAIPAFLPEVMPAVEIGWRLARSWWGKGIATEAAAAVAAYAFDVIGLDELVSIRHLDNVASGRVMEKIGMTHDRDTVVPASGVKCAVYRLRRRARV
jgi:RimJ/RimL family protein N-acetyltransferase